MNATTPPKMSTTQIAALEQFQRRCQQAMLRVALAATVTIAVALLVSQLNTQMLPLVIIMWATMVVYPSLLIAVIRVRTGLWWHSLNAHAVWVGISFILLIMLIMLLNVVIPALQGDVLLAGQFDGDILGLAIVLPLFAFAFKSSTRTRAEAERAEFGDRWLRLDDVTLRDIFLLRIPYERA
jgi:hypothetical protein